MGKYYLLTVMTPDGRYFNAVTARQPAETLLEWVNEGIVLVYSEKISKKQYNSFKDVLDTMD